MPYFAHSQLRTLLYSVAIVAQSISLAYYLASEEDCWSFMKRCKLPDQMSFWSRCKVCKDPCQVIVMDFCEEHNSLWHRMMRTPEALGISTTTLLNMEAKELLARMKMFQDWEINTDSQVCRTQGNVLPSIPSGGRTQGSGLRRTGSLMDLEDEGQEQKSAAGLSGVQSDDNDEIIDIDNKRAVAEEASQRADFEEDSQLEDSQLP